MKNHFEVAKEEIQVYGVEEASLQNMLAIIIGPKATPDVTGSLASLGINRLADLGIDDLQKFNGIGETSARRIISCFGIANHIRKYKREESFAIKSPSDAADYLADLSTKLQEQIDVLYLNAKNVVLARRTIFKGSLNSSIIHPREIFKEALKMSCASIIISHNHPSGSPNPSEEDIETTSRIKEAGEVLGVELLDHVIIGSEGKYVSMREKGYF